VFVLHTQLKATTIRQRDVSRMNVIFWTCCIINCGVMHVQSCH
jgi:hypothetical protein